METISKWLLKTVTTCFVLSVLAILFSLVSREESLAKGLSEVVAFYGSVVTIYLFIIYIILFALAKVFKSK